MDAPEPKAEHVIEALTRVMRDLPGIGKDGRADPKQGGYAYRGIEQITSHTQALFARHGVVFVPHVRSYEIRELTVNNKPWTDTVELVEYTVYGPGGIEDHITVGPVLAIGRDNSDKGGNKCLTQAYKYALLQALCISDSKDDTDGETHEADRPVVQQEPPEGHLWAKDAKERVVAAAEGDKELAGRAWQAAGLDQPFEDGAPRWHINPGELAAALAEAERLMEADADGMDQAEAGEQVAEQETAF